MIALFIATPNLIVALLRASLVVWKQRAIVNTLLHFLSWRVVQMTSLEVREFSMNLNKYISESPLPAEVKKYVLADIYNELNKQADEEIIKNLKEREGVNE